MEISQQLTCPCNNKVYRSSVSLKSHQKTQGHLFWEQNKEQKDILIKINRLENENSHLRRLNILLMERIQELKSENNLKI
jgi:hypothetical protein